MATAGRTTKLDDDFTVSAIGFGAGALASGYGDADDAESLATLNRCLDLGVTFIDTADVYGGGSNERLIARLLADRRDEVTLATKFGMAGNLADRAAGRRRVRGDAAYVRQCIDESLARLQTDVVDLYYMHRRDLTVPIEETVGAMAELVCAGKVRHLGLSEVTAGELRAAVAVHPIAAVQSEWSIWSRDVERQVVPAAAELGVGFVPYSPLGRGFLTGTIRSAADLSSPSDFRHTSLGSPTARWKPTLRWSMWSGRLPRNSLRRRRRSRWHGCVTAPRPSVWPRYRFPAPGGRHASRRTLARCRSP
jgi:aryl-alcohol dehydrogenase-like predicted oxidoreductase